jgi:NodT family efflux transporter outer membrane factor (OMF) lipoprotein
MQMQGHNNRKAMHEKPVEASLACSQRFVSRFRVGACSGLRRIRSRNWLAALAGLGLFAGCNAGPDYVRPRLDISSNFSQWPSTQPATAPSTRTVVSVHAPPLTDLAHWWEAMRDPELNSLLSRAVAGNLDVQVAIDRLQQSRALLAQFGGQSLPDVNLSGVAGQGTSNNLARGGLVDGPLAASVNTSALREVTQVLGVDTEFELDIFGNLRREGQAIAADTAVANEVRNQVLVTLLGDVARTYVGIRTLQLRVSIAQKTIDVQKHAADVERQRFERGITNELDSALADREVETTQATLPPLQAQLLMAKRNLAVLLGDQPDALLLELDAQSALPRPPAEIDAGLPVDLLRRRPDVRQAEAQLVAANARLDVATTFLYPRIFMTAAGGFQSQGFGREPVAYRGLWEAAPAISWPILDFGTVDANIQSQDQATRAQAVDFKKVVLSAIAEVDNGLTTYDAERRRLDSLGRAIADAQRALDLATQRYDRGIIDYLNVLDAQRSLFTLQDQQAVSENLAVSDFVDVCQSLGGGWEGFPPPKPLNSPLPAILATVRDATGNSDRPLGH